MSEHSSCAALIPIASSERPACAGYTLCDCDEFGYVVAVVAAYAVNWCWGVRE